MKPFLYVFLTLFVFGCASSVRYERAVKDGPGYSETKLQDGVYSIQFKGNSSTSFQKVADFALLRSAEIALENGYSFFTIAGGQYDSEVSSETTSAPGYHSAYGWPGSWGWGWQTRVYQQPYTYFMIECYKEAPEKKTAPVFNAAEVKANVRNQYRLPETASASKTQ